MDAGGEVELKAAHAFSREAFGEEMTGLDVVCLHRRVVERLSIRTSSIDVELISASFSYLFEALSAFEMTQRGYWEAQHYAASEHAIALSLQHDLLPRAVPAVSGLDLSVRYVPGEVGSHAGGDWCDIFELDTNRVGLVVGDVSGTA